MNLNKKKALAARTFHVGKDRIVLVSSRIEEISKAITKQDMRDLYKEGAILIKEIKGRKTILKRKIRRGPGSIRKKLRTRKKDYVIMTRKLRRHISELRNKGKLSKEEIIDIRKKIRNKAFKSKANLKEHIGGLRD